MNSFETKSLMPWPKDFWEWGPYAKGNLNESLKELKHTLSDQDLQKKILNTSSIPRLGAAFATGLKAWQLQDNRLVPGCGAPCQHFRMTRDIACVRRWSSRDSGVISVLRPGKRQRSWKMGQPDSITCNGGTWNRPQDLTKYLRIASNKSFTCFEVGEKDWIAATNAATNVVMLPSQHSSFLPRQVLHTAKNGQSFHDSIRPFFMEKEFVAKSMMVLASCTEHYHETLLQSMNPTSWNQLDSVVAMDHVPVP